MHDPTDPLSATARQLLKLNPDGYQKLVVTGDGYEPARQILRDVKPSQLVEANLPSPRATQAMLAGLWLFHGWLDESHRISQSLDTPTGSFWHAIMHRREGDFSNSKYWYARCADHPSLQPLAANAAAALNSQPADKSLLRLIVSGWNPNAFVDLVEAVHESPTDSRYRIAVTLQRLEWQTLFDHCTREAANRS
jgi:hypothetical protein